MLEIRLDSLGERVRALRSSRTWTLQEFEQMTGISWSWLSKIEKNRVDPKLSHLCKIANSLGVRVAYLIGDEDTGIPLRAAVSLQALRIFLEDADLDSDSQQILQRVAENEAGPSTPEGWAKLVPFVARPRPKIIDISNE